MKNTILDLIDISQYAGNRADYTQGGGGNTSVKNEEKGLMLIKASGYKLKDISMDNAFVAVDRKKIFDYYNSVDLSIKKDYEKESAELSKNSVVALDGIATLRPSVEVGFHAILKKYVIHTHSVYANILTCAKEGEELANKLFKGKDYGFIFLPYINPGFELTLAMKKGIEDYVAKNGKYPEVIFMKNHGLVVNSDDIDRVKAVNTSVNEVIREYFKLPDNFREVKLVEGDNCFISGTPIVQDFIKNNKLDKEFLDRYPLYPDQLVYLNKTITLTPDMFEVNGDKVIYRADLKQSTTLEETLSAYLFVITAIKNNGLTLNTMSEKEVYFINNWEAEKYRRTVK
ncbi:MAG: class II aldolase/adducin family protein [Clostridia bacterium]|nr:class II aldolase/adducin family protein [Clostridia bacterium]